MQSLPVTAILQREALAQQMRDALDEFSAAANEPVKPVLRGIYVCGKTGVGKTEFVREILKSLNYDVISYDLNQSRPKTVVDAIAHNNMTNRSVISMFGSSPRRLAILLDDIDGCERSGLGVILGLVRVKRTKRQKTEGFSLNPIICVGQPRDVADKAARDLMRACVVLELTPPTADQMAALVAQAAPHLSAKTRWTMANYAQGDLRRLDTILHLNTVTPNNPNTASGDVLGVEDVLSKSGAETVRALVANLFLYPHAIESHTTTIPVNERAVVSMVWHENVVREMSHAPPKSQLAFYLRVLEHMCAADYVDRMASQKMLWQFSEMNSLWKTFAATALFHEHIGASPSKPRTDQMLFTKILTKYSSECNNAQLVQRMCQNTGLDRKDLFALIADMRARDMGITEVAAVLEEQNACEVTRSDATRLFRWTSCELGEKGSNGGAAESLDVNDD